MIRTIAIALCAAAFLATPAHAQQPQTPPPPACDGAAHRALDFWIGEWVVYVTGTENLAGRSTIAREDNGCVVTEHWRSARTAYTGRSLNLYDKATGKWRQFWVDSRGDVTDFTGEPTADGLRYVAAGDVSEEDRNPHFARMTFTRNADGTVRQLGENSADGAAWSVTYDFTYRRRA